MLTAIHFHELTGNTSQSWVIASKPRNTKCINKIQYSWHICTQFGLCWPSLKCVCSESKRVFCFRGGFYKKAMMTLWKKTTLQRCCVLEFFSFPFIRGRIMQCVLMHCLLWSLKAIAIRQLKQFIDEKFTIIVFCFFFKGRKQLVWRT